MPTNVSACKICVRREVVRLHAVVVAQRVHKATRRRREATLVETDEADDVAKRRVGLPVPRRWLDPRRGTPILVCHELAGGHQLAQGKPRRRRARPRQWVDDGDGLRGSLTDRLRSVEREASAMKRRRSERGSGSEAEGARTANTKCGGKDSPRLPPRIYRSMELRSLERTPCVH
jgi:hypothetical protein